MAKASKTSAAWVQSKPLGAMIKICVEDFCRRHNTKYCATFTLNSRPWCGGCWSFANKLDEFEAGPSQLPAMTNGGGCHVIARVPYQAGDNICLRHVVITDSIGSTILPTPWPSRNARWPAPFKFCLRCIPHTQRFLHIEKYQAKWCLLKCMVQLQKKNTCLIWFFFSVMETDNGRTVPTSPSSWWWCSCPRRCPSRILRS